jgi:hypothetical protein
MDERGGVDNPPREENQVIPPIGIIYAVEPIVTRLHDVLVCPLYYEHTSSVLKISSYYLRFK